MMGLINHDEVEFAFEQLLGVLTPARQRHRRDQPLLAPELIRVAAHQRIVGGGAGDVELGLQLLAPLSDQRCRHQHQHALDHAAQQVLLEHHAGFDGLTEPDFVRQQYPAAELLEHLAHGLDLIPEGFDPMQMGQTQQLVETLGQTEMGKAFAQSIPPAVGFWRGLPGGQQRSRIELDREWNFNVNPRQTGQRNGRFVCGHRRARWRCAMRMRGGRAFAAALDAGRPAAVARVRAAAWPRFKTRSSNFMSHLLRPEPPGKTGMAR